MLPGNAAAVQPRPPFLVERYAVFDEFAAGGMATVHFARLTGAHGFRRTVAVKRLLPHLTRNQDFALMLIDEARLAARISHPNVVSTLDVVQSESELLLVMEYVHGESLAKLSRWARERSERIPVPIACAIVADALHGLHAAHEATDERGAALNLVHRDVSPQNVLVGLDGVSRIADFGVAKAAGRAQATGDGVLKGKLAYMAPEQLSSGEVSRATDVFAAAAVLWEALTNERLFAGKNHAETAFKVLSAPIPTPRSRGASIPADLEAVVMRGLARDPAQRFASAHALALAIEGAVPGVRSSDLARWVEQVVGDRLAKRAALLRAIERSSEADPSAKAQAPLPSSTARAADAPARPLDQVEPLATPDSLHEPAYDKTVPNARGGRYLLWSAVLALLALGAAAALLRRSESSASPSAPASGAAAQPSAHAAQQNVRGLAARGAASSTPDAAEVTKPQLPPMELENQAATEAPRTRVTRDGKAHSKRPGCDPPFSIDSAGHMLFKPECM
jgi:serine/threonine-protein kinase